MAAATSLDRRQLLLPALGLALAGAAYGGYAATRKAPATAAVPLRQFGARGDGVSDDTAALKHALATGRPLDGGGQVYGVRGDLNAGRSFRGLANCTLRQLAPTLRVRTLTIDGASNFRLANVAFQRGRADDEAGVLRDLIENAALWITGCSGFVLDHVTVSGGGFGTGVMISESHGFQVVDLTVRDVVYRRHQRPTNDVFQGLWINRGKDFDLIRPVVRNLGGQDDQGFTHDNNRAIAIGGSSNFRVRDIDLSDCGQGLDVTGTEGNRNFQVTGGVVRDCWTFGFKFANSASGGAISGGRAERCGLAGFVVSGPTEGVDPPSQDITFSDCTAIDCGRPNQPGTMFGFGVMRALPVDYPRRIRFVRCTAIDRRTPAGMKWGFFNEIHPPQGQANTIEGCTVSGAALKPTFGFPKAGRL